MAEKKDRKCWVMGRSVESDGVREAGITRPFIVFDDEGTANQAADMVKNVSGEKPAVVEGSLWRERKPRQPRERRAKAVTS
jgi:hypothetical protein